MEYAVLLDGPIGVDEKTILRFYPSLKSLLEEIRGRGWAYRFARVEGRARVKLDLDKLSFNLQYHPPHPRDLAVEGVYEISAEVGSKPPAVLEVEEIRRLSLSVSPREGMLGVTVDPLSRTIEYISNPLWGLASTGGRRPESLAEARLVYEVARFFLEKDYKLKDTHVAEDYQELVRLFEGKYSFTITLELTVEDENKVPGWSELQEQLTRFFQERGLIATFKRDKGLNSLLRKPLP